jgi:hypothetical protein
MRKTMIVIHAGAVAGARAWTLNEWHDKIALTLAELWNDSVEERFNHFVSAPQRAPAF